MYATVTNISWFNDCVIYFEDYLMDVLLRGKHMAGNIVFHNYIFCLGDNCSFGEVYRQLYGRKFRFTERDASP